MTIHRCSIAAVLALAVAATPAAAGKKTAAETFLDRVIEKLHNDPFPKPEWTTRPSDLAGFDPPEACFAIAQGLAAGTKVRAEGAWRIDGHGTDDQGRFLLPADVLAICKRYQAVYVREAIEGTLVDAMYAQAEMKKAVEGAYEADAQRVGITGAACVAQVDAALAAGMKATDTIVSERYDLPPIALGDAKATYCQPAIDFGVARTAAIQQLAQAKQDAIVAVYKQAGMKGKKLELFASFGLPADAGLLAAGCTTWLDTIAKIKKAKKVFVWLEGAGGYTVRKYALRGNDYTVSERTYSTQEGAYSGCR